MTDSESPTKPFGLADLHLHTCHSDGRDTPEQVVDGAVRAGMDVIAVTDHDNIEGAVWAARYARSTPAEIEVIVGEEVSSMEGHILGLFLERRVAPGLSALATVAAIHAQGGLAVAAHPFWRTASSHDQPHACGVGQLAESIAFDAIEIVNGGPTPRMWAANRRARAFNARLGRPALGASDAHVAEAIGWAHSAFPGRTADDLRRALLAGQTAPRTRPCGLQGIVRYAAWGLSLASRPSVATQP